MGNIASCYTATAPPNTAKLIDLHRETARVFALPTTAAELMLEEPGTVVSPANHLRRDRRFSAMKADDTLTAGGVYLLIPISRVNAKVSESEMAALDSFCAERRPKRRTSKVQPLVADGCCDQPARLLGEETHNIGAGAGAGAGALNNRVKHWKPALEPIYEGI